MFCAAFLTKKLIYEILTSKLAPSLVYHGLVRALLSLAFIRQLWEGGREKVGFENGTLPSRFSMQTIRLRELVMLLCVEFLNTSYLVTIQFIYSGRRICHEHLPEHGRLILMATSSIRSVLYVLCSFFHTFALQYFRYEQRSFCRVSAQQYSYRFLLYYYLKFTIIYFC